MDKHGTFSGNLSFLNLSEVLQIIGSNASTGELIIHSKYTESKGIIIFQNGEPINASNGDMMGLKALYSIFGWGEGDFEFANHPVSAKKVITKSRTVIIREAENLLESGKLERLGPISFEKSAASEGANKDDLHIPVVKGPLVDYMYIVDEEDYVAGDTVVKQGKHGNWVWVILDGLVDIYKETARGRVPILRVGRGAFIGSLAAFLIQRTVRRTTILAHTDLQLGVLDSHRLNREFASLSTDFKSLVLSLDKRLNQTTLKTSAGYFEYKNVESIVEGANPIISQDEEEESVFVIDRGRVHVVRTTEDDTDVLLAELSDGDIIGKIPFLNVGHEPEAASVYASADIQVNAVDMKGLQNEYNQHSLTFKNMLTSCATMISGITMTACEYAKKWND